MTIYDDSSKSRYFAEFLLDYALPKQTQTSSLLQIPSEYSGINARSTKIQLWITHEVQIHGPMWLSWLPETFRSILWCTALYRVVIAGAGSGWELRFISCLWGSWPIAVEAIGITLLWNLVEVRHPQRHSPPSTADIHYFTDIQFQFPNDTCLRSFRFHDASILYRVLCRICKCIMLKTPQGISISVTLITNTGEWSVL